MCPNQKIRTTSLVLLVAFLVTAAILFVLVPNMGRFFAYRYSAHFVDGYDLIASNLASGNGYRWQAGMGETMIREPGYPLFLAAVFKIAGYHIEAARFANWLLTIGIAWMIMRLTKMVTNDGGAALVASLLFLFHPGVLIAEARGGVEILSIFVALVFMLVLYRAVEKGNPWRYFVAGLVLGIVIQVRSTPLAFPALLLVYLCWTANSARERLRAIVNVATLVLGMAMVMMPWIMRNYMLVQKFVPTATVLGLAVQEGQYASQHLSFRRDYYAVQDEAGRERSDLATKLGLRFEGVYYYQVFYEARDEWGFYNGLLQRAEKTYVEHPSLLASCVGKNLFNFWFLGKTWTVTCLNMVIQVPVIVLALSGLHLLRKRGQLHRMGMMLTFALTIMFVTLPVIAAARYSIPVVAFLAIPASLSVLSMWHRCWAQGRTEAAPASSSIPQASC